jgi:formylglycine-generating enzyme required for sulfatase activity
MAGNVWEWTRSLWGTDFGKPDFGYPYEPADGREDLKTDARVFRVLRGGSFLYGSGGARCAVRIGFNPVSRFGYIGFRVLLSPLFSNL